LTIENVEALRFLREQYRIKGKGNLFLVWRMLRTVKGYSVLTVRQLFYILVSRFPKDYPATHAFYKRMNRYLCKIRRVNADVNGKFIDPTRRFTVPPMQYPEIEIWVEKDSIRNFIAKLAAKYRLGIQVLRGFGSLSMYRKALERARKRGVTMVLYIGDFDPSGLLIETVAQEEMDHRRGIRFVRIALTMEQIKRFKPPSRPVNLKDTRAKEYLQKYGGRCWEVEAIRPRTLHRLIETGLKQAVPAEYLAVAEAKEKAARLARPITERLRKTVEKEAFHMLAAGATEEEIFTKISQKYGIKLRGKKINEGVF
jgi:uncharacterized protein YggT (Ycf19 family)